MDFLNSFYANFFTVGALIPTAFHVFLAYVFLSIKNKSKPTFHFGISYLFSRCSTSDTLSPVLFTIPTRRFTLDNRRLYSAS